MEVVKIVPEAAKVEILVPPVKPHVLIWKHTQSVMFMLCPCTHTARIQTSTLALVNRQLGAVITWRQPKQLLTTQRLTLQSILYKALQICIGTILTLIVRKQRKTKQLAINQRILNVRITLFAVYETIIMV